MFITIEDLDLVNLMRQVSESEYDFGEEIGIISYTDTQLKEWPGIIEISTVFNSMGDIAALLILSRLKQQITTPYTFIDGDSL